MDCNFTVISRNHFYVSTFCAVAETANVPLFYCLNALYACLPPLFNALEDACLPQLPSMFITMHASCFPSMLLRMPASPPLPFNALEDALPPAFKSLDACLPPPFHSDSETHLTSCCKSHFLLIRFCFIYFDFLIITTMRRNYLLVSHVLFISQHCSPILACSTYQKSMNFSHNSVK